MTSEQTELLTDIKGSLKHLAKVAEAAPEPTQSILVTQIFILVQKVAYLLEGPEE